ncbi:hypothetical protein V5799_019158 [Amblyomma americanum]|uniref:Uncharacterized protein n=1 Tax=Amblyomma americanum TaxID=6943 RepID=A0AAQ4EYK2_AMBAM
MQAGRRGHIQTRPPRAWHRGTQRHYRSHEQQQQHGQLSVDGHCQPRRSSVGLRCIRVRSDEPEDVERLWKRTPPALVGEKRWKLRFEKNCPCNLDCDGTVPSECEPSPSDETNDVDYEKWAAEDAVTKSSSLVLPKIQALHFASSRGSWFLRAKLFVAGIVLAALAVYRMLFPARPDVTKPDLSECVELWGKAYCF